ncbi:MAG TPA: efflux RND transporter permease subunit, partial [Candidatus Acidoferrales bacterium]|nr:efflux RND transporter permease subunit [Candidatus Acidoferrales bacterium]
MKRTLGLAGKVAHAFIDSKLTPLIIIAAILLGAFAILQTPREEEPQIVVPMLDVMVAMPGATPQEVEQRVSVPMEKVLRQVSGVEYLYSISRPGASLVIVRFKVGTKEEDAIVKTYNQLFSHMDQIPAGVSQPLVKVRSIDDVPILALTLWGPNYDSYRLRQVAYELEHTIKQIDDVSETHILGGQPRAVRVVLDPARLAAHGVTAPQALQSLQAANMRANVGSFDNRNTEYQVDAGRFLGSAADLQQVVVTVRNGRPVYLRDVAEKIEDGPAEPTDYVLFGQAAGTKQASVGTDYPAVTLTVAKRKGTNATNIAHTILERVSDLRGNVLPNDLNVTVTRNYGETAKEKSDELLKHLFIATLSVTVLIALALGWRESGVVLLAVPVTLALTLAIF